MKSIREVMRSGVVAQAMTAGIGAASRATSQMVTLVVSLFAARELAPTAFGTFAIASAWVTLVRTIFYGGAYEYLLKTPDPRKASTECLVTNLVVGVVLSVPLVVAAPFSVYMFKTAVVGQLLIALLPSNVFAALTAWQEALILRKDRLQAYYGAWVVSEIVGGVVTVAMLWKGYGVWALVAQVYVRPVVMLVGFLFLDATVFSERFSRARFDEVMHWSLSRHFAVFLGFGTSYASDIILGFTLSPAAAGLYRASNRIVTAVADVITQPARMMALAAFSRLAANGRTAERQWAAFAAASAIIGWSALGGLAVVGPMLVPMLLGPAWKPAAMLVPILCAARALPLLDMLSGIMLVAYDRQKLVFRIQVASATVMLIALVASAPFGVAAATWGVLVAAVVSSALQTGYAWKHFPEAPAEFRRHAMVAVAPVAATVAVALLALRLSSFHARPVAEISLVVIAGAAAWGITVASMHRPLRHVLASLRPDRGGPLPA